MVRCRWSCVVAGRNRDGGGAIAAQPIKCVGNRLTYEGLAFWPSIIDIYRELPDRHPATFNSPLLLHTHFLSVCRQYAVDNKVCRLNGPARCDTATAKAQSPQELTSCAARSATALMPFRVGNAAFLSSSSSDKAMTTPATVPGNPGTPPPMKVARREVPLPSQEGKKGAIQYALYVESVYEVSGRIGEIDRS